jgi:hypothetical protein
MNTYRPAFFACYDQYRELNGQPFSIVRVIDTADETHDQEVLPMFVIQIDGKQIEAWPEEVIQEHAS